MLDQLCVDVINMIISYLNGKDAFELLISCKQLYNMTTQLLYYFPIDDHKVKHLSYFNQFRRLKYTCSDGVYPSYGNQIMNLTYMSYSPISICWKHITHLNINYCDSLHQFVNLTHLTLHLHRRDELFSPSGHTMVPKVKYLKVSCFGVNHPVMKLITSDGQVISFIPDGVQQLVLDFIGDFDIRYLIPHSVIDLKVESFDYQLFDGNDKYIPDSVVYLNLGRYFNKPLIMDNGQSALPNKIIKLDLGNSYTHTLMSVLPSTLQELRIGERYAKKLSVKGDKRIPDRYDSSYSAIPPGLKKLMMGCEFDNPLEGNLPEGLIHLSLGFEFKQKILRLPTTLVYLKFRGKFNHDLPIMPPSLRYLEVGFKFNKSIDKCLNDDLHTLLLGSEFDRKITKLPSKLKVLKIYDNIDSSLIHVLPDGLQELVINRKWHQNIWKTSIEQATDIIMKKLVPVGTKLPSNLRVSIQGERLLSE